MYSHKHWSWSNGKKGCSCNGCWDDDPWDGRFYAKFKQVHSGDNNLPDVIFQSNNWFQMVIKYKPFCVLHLNKTKQLQNKL